jgi:hypothetical protein
MATPKAQKPANRWPRHPASPSVNRPGYQNRKTIRSGPRSRKKRT